MLYRVAWTVSQDETISTREYIASLDDAWELWYWLTSRSVMEPEYQKKLLEQKRESALFAPYRTPPTTEVRVYELSGAEVSPEEGTNGMHRLKNV